MQLKPEQERVSSLLKETITLMCKNGLKFETKFTIDAVIGVTLDEKEVFLISVNEMFSTERSVTDDHENGSNASDGEMASTGRRKRRRRERHMKRESGSDGESEQERADGDENPDEARNHDSNDDGSIMFIKEEPEASSWQTAPPPCSFQEQNNGEPAEVNFSAFPAPDISRDATDLNFGDASFTSGVSQTLIGHSGPRQHSSAPYLPTSGNHTALSQIGTNQTQGQNQMLSSGRRYSCHICSKTYGSKSGLHLHLRWHRGDYLHRCTVCGKGFMSTVNLKGHMSWHTGRKEFKCDRCHKEFRYKYDLSEHYQFCKVVSL